GEEDDVINEYFIKTAFPTEDMMNSIVEVVTSKPGIKKSAIEMYTDIKSKTIEKSLKYLDVNGDIYVEKSQYYKTPKPWKADMERSQTVTAIRRKEMEDIEIFSKTSDCYMEFIAKELDDNNAHACGRCANCLGKSRYNSVIEPEALMAAQKFIKNDFNIIEPRKQWPDSSCSEDNKSKITFVIEEGRVLSNYGDAGWGCQVSKDKYKRGEFGDELVTASYELLKDFVRENEIAALTYIPSLRRPNLVKNFAEKLAERLGLEFFTALEKIEDAVCQKTLNNSYNQWKNVNDSFAVTEIRTGNTLLVDDMVDSRWTFTCCGYKMLKEGNGKIYPFALANSAGKGNE
ncbi:MAG: ATP-dependent DNA helicase RecG, partial [Lachnospiraceae bacterium]|nr:ATP-dependent DNA helicase RecG [Lachnospiraceae bacterium]